MLGLGLELGLGSWLRVRLGLGLELGGHGWAWGWRGCRGMLGTTRVYEKVPVPRMIRKASSYTRRCFSRRACFSAALGLGFVLGLGLGLGFGLGLGSGWGSGSGHLGWARLGFVQGDVLWAARQHVYPLRPRSWSV